MIFASHRALDFVGKTLVAIFYIGGVLVLLVPGLVGLAAGTLFMLQGSGVVQWPRESFMLNQGVWIGYGATIVLVSAGFLCGAWVIWKRHNGNRGVL